MAERRVGVVVGQKVLSYSESLRDGGTHPVQRKATKR